jgi:hypothetical protein
MQGCQALGAQSPDALKPVHFAPFKKKLPHWQLH